MSADELKSWLELIDSAPEPIKTALLCLFWILVALVILWLILKIILNSQFKEFYSLIKEGGKKLKNIGAAVARGAADALVPPQPYPRIAKFFTVLFMLNSYAAALVFSLFGALMVALAILSDRKEFFAPILVAVVATLFFGFAWAFFNQAERDRLGLKFKGGS